MGMVGEDYGTGGRHPKGLGGFFQGGSARGALIQVVYVGADPLHGKGPGKLLSKVFQADNVEETKSTGGGGGW